jgi:hypothetical protein
MVYVHGSPDFAVGAEDALQVGDAHRQEDVVAKGPDVVTAKVQNLTSPVLYVYRVTKRVCEKTLKA